MNPIYDVAILGCGEAGIFAAYELARRASSPPMSWPTTAPA